MNITLIILGIVILVLMYVLYKYFSVSASTLQSTAYLKTVNPPITSIQNPTNSRYAYGIWAYINTWDANATKVIFSRAGNIKLYMDNFAPILKCDFTMIDKSIQTLFVTDNFPLQKWVFIIVSVDGQYVDFYLDGKLVKSQRLYSTDSKATPTAKTLTPATPPDSDVPIILGSATPFDAYVANFQRWISPVDPQTAWSAYMAGNGGSSIANTVSAYGVNVSVLKNNIEQSKYVLF